MITHPSLATAEGQTAAALLSRFQEGDNSPQRDS